MLIELDCCSGLNYIFIYIFYMNLARNSLVELCLHCNAQRQPHYREAQPHVSRHLRRKHIKRPSNSSKYDQCAAKKSFISKKLRNNSHSACSAPTGSRWPPSSARDSPCPRSDFRHILATCAAKPTQIPAQHEEVAESKQFSSFRTPKWTVR